MTTPAVDPPDAATVVASSDIATEAVLIIDGLSVALPPGGDRDHAVRDVSLSIAAGKTLCVVGESGSGKSVMATAVMGLLPRELRAVAKPSGS